MPAALVTGGSRGIGRAIAERFAADGYDVVVNYHSDREAAETVVGAIEDGTANDAIAVRADVADPDAVDGMVAEAVERFGGLDHVVNNAGVNSHRFTPELSIEEFDRVLKTNITGSFAVTKAALTHLRESTVSPGPSVTYLSSRIAHTGAAYEPHYAASKAGVIALAKSHASEFAPEIRVNAVAPGFVETDMTDRTNTEADKEDRRDAIPLHRLGRPEDIAEAAAYLRDAEFVTGETLDVNGGQTMR